MARILKRARSAKVVKTITAEDRWGLSSRLRPETPNIPNEHLILDMAASYGRKRNEIVENLLLFPRNVDCIMDDAQRAAVCAWLGISEPTDEARILYAQEQVSRSSAGGEDWMVLVKVGKLVNPKSYHALRYKRLDEQVGRGIKQEQYRRAKHIDDAAGYAAPRRASQIGDVEIERSPSGVEELDILGGSDKPGEIGWCVGDLVLVGGEPGIGKSKLLIMMASVAAAPQCGNTVYYNQGEFRVEVFNKRYCKHLLKGDEDLYIEARHNLAEIVDDIYRIKPRFVYLDSKDKINECETKAGWKRTEKWLRKAAADVGCTIFIITHLNQEGGIMGGRSIEHDVDVVIRVYGVKDMEGCFAVEVAKNRGGASGSSVKAIYRHLGKRVICVKGPSRAQMDNGILEEEINPLLEKLPESICEQEEIEREESALLARISAVGFERLTEEEKKRLGDITEWKIRRDDKDMLAKLKEQLRERKQKEKDAKKKEKDLPLPPPLPGDLTWEQGNEDDED